MLSRALSLLTEAYDTTGTDQQLRRQIISMIWHFVQQSKIHALNDILSSTSPIQHLADNLSEKILKPRI